MNKFYTSNFKFRYFNSVINKILIKVSLNTRNKSNYPLSLSLLREEIQKIIITYVAIEFNRLFYSLSKASPKNINNKVLIDIIFKILLISSKKKITLRLSISKDIKLTKLNSFNSWLIKDIEIQEYNLFIFILNSLKPSSKKKNSFLLAESLIENFIIKLSDIIVYELYNEPKFSMTFLLEYTTDFLVFKNKIKKLRLLVYSRKFFDIRSNFFKKIYSNSYSIIILAKQGLLLKSINSDYHCR
jgi:septum formation topological specificity factor MinE